jgi:hypothetical protein
MITMILQGPLLIFRQFQGSWIDYRDIPPAAYSKLKGQLSGSSGNVQNINVAAAFVVVVVVGQSKRFISPGGEYSSSTSIPTSFLCSILGR